MAMQHRHLRVWTATHENGWTALVTEHPDGTFAAVAVPDADRVTASADYIEDSPETAMTAALYALKSKTGHDVCSARCGGWESYTHLYEYDDGE